MPDNLGIFNILIVMPNLRNAKKALRQTKKRALRNKTIKTAYKSATKAVKKAVVAGEEMGDKIVLAQKKLDKALKRNLVGQAQPIASVPKSSTTELPVEEPIADTDENLDE